MQFETLAEARNADQESFDSAITDSLQSASEVIGKETTIRALQGTGRALRRHHTQRIKAKVSEWLPAEELTPRVVGIRANARKASKDFLDSDADMSKDCVFSKGEKSLPIGERRLLQREKFEGVDLIQVVCQNCSHQVDLPPEQATNYYVCDVCR